MALGSQPCSDSCPQESCTQSFYRLAFLSLPAIPSDSEIHTLSFFLNCLPEPGCSAAGPLGLPTLPLKLSLSLPCSYLSATWLTSTPNSNGMAFSLLLHLPCLDSC